MSISDKGSTLEIRKFVMKQQDEEQKDIVVYYIQYFSQNLVKQILNNHLLTGLELFRLHLMVQVFIS